MSFCFCYTHYQIGCIVIVAFSLKVKIGYTASRSTIRVLHNAKILPRREYKMYRYAYSGLDAQKTNRTMIEIRSDK